jgi:tRNA threonylcarbamoyladenosine modification (KEOPS) complex Cgi121 subunit
MKRVYARAFVLPQSVDPEAAKEQGRKTIPRGFVQTTRASAASNAFFIEMIAAQTLTAKSVGALLAKKPEIDFLLRLAGTTQIARAIKEVGTREKERSLLVMAQVDGVPHAPKWRASKELKKGRLTKSELWKIERSALLNALRP